MHSPYTNIDHAILETLLPPTYAIPPLPGANNPSVIEKENKNQFILDCINKERTKLINRMHTKSNNNNPSDERDISPTPHQLSNKRLKTNIPYPISGILRQHSKVCQFPTPVYYQAFSLLENEDQIWQDRTVENNLQNINNQDNWRKGLAYPPNVSNRKTAEDYHIINSNWSLRYDTSIRHQ